LRKSVEESPTNDIDSLSATPASSFTASTSTLISNPSNNSYFSLNAVDLSGYFCFSSSSSISSSSSQIDRNSSVVDRTVRKLDKKRKQPSIHAEDEENNENQAEHDPKSGNLQHGHQETEVTRRSSRTVKRKLLS